MKDLTSKCVIVVFPDQLFDETDYIRHRVNFQTTVEEE